MTRTKRATPLWGKIYENTFPCTKVGGRDGVYYSPTHMPNASCPSGFDTFEEAGHRASSWAKRHTARLLRRRAKQHLLEDDYEDPDCR